jgi:hypothetical protein
MKLRLLPQTKVGRFSLGALLIFALALLIRVLQINDILDILAFFLEYIAGTAALISGLISMLMYKERSVLVLVYTVVPLVALLFVLIR